MSMKEKTVTVRVWESLADEFKQVVKEQGYTQSLVIRELMQDYILKTKNPELSPEQDVMRHILKKGEKSGLEFLADMTVDEMLCFAEKMAKDKSSTLYGMIEPQIIGDNVINPILK